MTITDKKQALFQIARALATAELNEIPSVHDRSRYTYAAVATYRSRYGKRPTQAVIDAVRFDFIW